MAEPRRWSSEEVAEMNRSEPPDRRRRRAQAIRLAKAKDETLWVRTCPYCQRTFCPIRYHYGKVRPNARRVTCGEPICQAQGRYAGALGMKNYGHVARGGGRPKSTAPKPTHCPAGHPYNEKNTYVRANGSFQCRPCHAALMRRRRRARR